MNVFAKFDEIPSKTLQDIKETKRHGHTFVRSGGGGGGGGGGGIMTIIIMTTRTILGCTPCFEYIHFEPFHVNMVFFILHALQFALAGVDVYDFGQILC